MVEDASEVNTSQTKYIDPSNDLTNRLEDEYDDGVEIVLKKGDHRLTGPVNPKGDSVIRGEDGATITAPDDRGRWFLQGDCHGEFALQNITFSYTNGGNVGCIIRAHGDALFKDISFEGFNESERHSVVDNIAPIAAEEDVTFRLDNVSRTGPTYIVSHGSKGDDANEGCIWLGDNHVGHLEVVNCRFENTGTNAIYSSRVRGSVTLRNTVFRNNNQASARLGGGDGVLVENCVFIVDTDNAHSQNEGGYINPTGLVLETKRVAKADITIRDSDFWVKSGPERSKNMYIDGNVGPIVVENSRLRVSNGRSQSVYMQSSARWGSEADDKSVTFRQCELTGDGVVDAGGRPVTVEGGTLSCPSTGVNTTGGVSTTGGEKPRETPSAAAGSSSGSSSATSRTMKEHRITIEASGESAQYELVGEKGITPIGETTVSSYETLSGDTITGWVTEDTDQWLVTGRVESFRFLDGETTVKLDGVPIDNPEKMLPQATETFLDQLDGQDKIVLAALAIGVMKEVLDS